MKNNANIYDINGDIIRKSGDIHEWTLQEAQEKLKYYKSKLEEEEKSENPNKTLIATYNTYIRNLGNYAAYKMSQLSGEELMNIIGKNNLKKTDTEEINNALNDAGAIKSSTNEVQEESVTNSRENNTNEESGNDEIIGRNDSNIPEKRPIDQSDLLVERDSVNTIMDEYVDYE